MNVLIKEEKMNTINEKAMSLFAECEVCKEKFQVTTSNVTNKKEFNVNGQSIFLTYYDCPKCGRRHYVQIDDAVSLNKLKEVSRQFIKLAAEKKKGKEIPQKQSAKFKKARQNLSDYRMNLVKEYTGKLLHDNETDSDFELRFSI